LATKRYRAERAPKMLRYFFWEDKLHRTLYIDKSRNILLAWSYDEGKKVQFVYSHIRVHRERAWRTSEVAKLLNRSKVTIARYIREERITPPVKSYSMDGDERYTGIGFWQAKDIYACHDFMLEFTDTGRRTRVDHRVPSRMELTAKMEEGTSYTLIDDEGNTTRAFKETLW